MLDTVRFSTEYLTEDVIDIISSKMVLKQALDFGSGENMYCILSNNFSDNTYNRNITVKIERQRWVRKNISLNGGCQMQTYKEDTEPYITVECSVHKILCGHNLYGGSDDLKLSVELVINNLSNIFDIDKKCFGNIDNFDIVRLDYAVNYRLSDVKAYFSNIKYSKYPRRNYRIYGNECLYFAGATTTLKFYDKHEEFKKHDYKFMKNDKLLRYSENILRSEIEVKKRKLKELFNSIKLKDIDMGKIINLHDEEVIKVFGIREVDTKKIYGADVFDRLLQTYNSSLAGILFTSYNILVLGDKELLKEKLPARTAYRHIKLLKDANIYWKDIRIEYTQSTKEFINFVPLSGSKCAIN